MGLPVLSITMTASPQSAREAMALTPSPVAEPPSSLQVWAEAGATAAQKQAAASERTEKAGCAIRVPSTFHPFLGGRPGSHPEIFDAGARILAASRTPGPVL